MSNNRHRDPTERATISAPAERVLREFEARNRRLGHENAGFLSLERGFVPLASPLTRLPQAFAAWDQLAAEMPNLFANLTLRRHARQLPLLDASNAALDDRFLLRAAALLAIVSHAYWYVDCRPPERLPDALIRPWAQVCARLRRQHEVLSYIDLIVYNWRVRAAQPQAELSLDDLELLFPTVGNQEERVFYLTQLEILARAGPLPGLLAAAQSAATRADCNALETCLTRIAAVFSYSAAALARIDPRTRAHTYVDPVRWAKTVAPLAVPFRHGRLGPSGTSSPLFAALDAFFGRSLFATVLGREIRALRHTYPPAWQHFLHALEAAPVSEFVSRCERRGVREAWHHALEQYVGRDGFLDRHRRKVYGYLEIAFKVGRSLTIGGFGGAFADRTWEEVDLALASAHGERPRAELGPAPAQPPSPPTAAGPSDRTAGFDVSEVVVNNHPERASWVVVDGSVCDVTRFLAAHPGGRCVLQAYAGCDASLGFARAHHGAARVERMRRALAIGEVRRLDFDDAACRAAYRVAVAALYLLVEMQNALALDCSFVLGAPARTPYERMRGFARHRRFLDEYVTVLETQALPRVWSAARTALFSERADILGSLLQRVQDGAEAAATRADAVQAVAAFMVRRSPALDAARIDAYGDADARLLVELKQALSAVVRAFEVHAPRFTPWGAIRIHRSCLRCVCALRRYYCRSAKFGPAAQDASVTGCSA